MNITRNSQMAFLQSSFTCFLVRNKFCTRFQPHIHQLFASKRKHKYVFQSCKSQTTDQQIVLIHHGTTNRIRLHSHMHHALNKTIFNLDFAEFCYLVVPKRNSTAKDIIFVHSCFRIGRESLLRDCLAFVCIVRDRN